VLVGVRPRSTPIKLHRSRLNLLPVSVGAATSGVFNAQASMCSPCKYDTIRYESVTWTEKLSVVSLINLAHVSENKKYVKKEETKTNKRQCQLSPVQDP